MNFEGVEIGQKFKEKDFPEITLRKVTTCLDISLDLRDNLAVVEKGTNECLFVGLLCFIESDSEVELVDE